MSGNVGIVIVSHSIDVAKGAADMVRQMVGEEVSVAFCGGNAEGGLGTDVTLILAGDKLDLVAQGRRDHGRSRRGRDQ